MPAIPLIGRDHPAALLRETLRRTVSSHGGLVLVSGEAGIGKTALVTEVVGEFGPDAALVFTATAWQGDGTPGFWPWVQVLRGLRRVATPGQWAAVDDAAGNALSHLIGESREDTPASASLFRIGDAVSEALLAACAVRPVFVVIDDLHRADPASLEVLAFVARHLWFERLALVCTVRDTELAADDHPLRTVFGEVAAAAHTIELTGLDAEQIGALVAALTGQRPPERIVAALRDLTGGNPFLIEQATRLWAAGNPLDSLTPGVRQTLDARLAPLPAAAVDALTTAALLGREFTAAALAASTGRADSADLLATAVRARLVTDDEDRYAFAHDLIRETLLARLDPAETRARHAAILAALERLPRPVSGATTGDLAHHAHRAGDAVDPERTLRYLLAAAHDACGRLAAREVATHYAHALELVPAADTELRCRIALGLAAAHRDAGELVAARRTYDGLLATADPAPELFARAALGRHELGMPDPEREAEHEIDLMERAHELLLTRRPRTDPLAVRVLAAGTRVRVHTGTARHDAVDRVSAETLTLARESGDDTALADALLARHDAIWQPGTARERLALADELGALGHGDAALQAGLLRFAALLELGDPRAHTELADLTARAERARSPRYRFVALSRIGALAMVRGRFAEARIAIDDAYALGARLGEVDVVPLWLEQRWTLALFTDELDEAESLVGRYRELAGDYTAVPELITSARRGDTERVARRAADIESLYRVYPRHFHAGVLVAQAHAALVLDDAELRDTVRAKLIPYEHYWAVVAGGGAVYGPYAYWLGRVCQAAGDTRVAAEHFETAAELAHRLRAQPWLDAARDQLRLLSHRPPQATPEPKPQPDNAFRFDGAVWVLRFDGRTAHLPDAKGLRDLHVLVGHPGQDIPSLELSSAPDKGIVRAAAALGSDPVLDDRAKASYRRRLSTLDAEIDRATELGHDDRAAELDRERAALLDELRRAAGLAGRTRRLGDDAERARKTVSARIRDALRRLDGVHPELAEHLRACVSLGVVCRYQPQREIRWTL
ncbi:AAA ATPase domain-containing protein [Nocardia amikacinitolerans]|uniref:ATP-binding protein n=1 Tax=Nocardia amikacinitolerans TaxID=756689 RepID=UPI0020A351EA|nr:AAA family ATPase [Nocardia amikacinitolerans]MCP2293895.1 AAA ATPase domain-containing protein [Nocardia amikacinitolerans]